MPYPDEGTKCSNEKAQAVPYNADQLPDTIVVTFVGIHVIIMQRVDDLLKQTGSNISTEEEKCTAVLLNARKTALPLSDQKRVNVILLGKHNVEEVLQLRRHVTGVTVRCIHLVTRKTIM